MSPHLRSEVLGTVLHQNREIEWEERFDMAQFIERLRPAWMNRGSCLGQNPEKWHSGVTAEIRECIAICHTCPVERQCLDHALDQNERLGVWGGKSERQRMRLRRSSGRTEGWRAA